MQAKTTMHLPPLLNFLNLGFLNVCSLTGGENEENVVVNPEVNLKKIDGRNGSAGVQQKWKPQL